MYFLASIIQQSWKNISMLYQWESLCKASDGCALRTYPPCPPIPLTPGHAAVPRPLPVHSVGCASSPWPGKLLAASGASVWLYESSGACGGGAAPGLWKKGGGWKWHQLLCLLPTPALLYFFFWTAGISDSWKWKCRSSALTSLCTSWVNTSLDTTWHNAGSNCWLQFAMVSCIKPFQHFLTNWPQLRRNKVSGYKRGPLTREIFYPTGRLANLLLRKQGVMQWN